MAGKLTGLPDQFVFGARLEDAFTRAGAGEEMVAVVFIDPDRFRTVNDVLGHAAGDKLLQQLSGRLTALLGEDNVLRMAGDEFVLLHDGLTGEEDHTQVFESVLRALQRPFACEGHQLFVTAHRDLPLSLRRRGRGDADEKRRLRHDSGPRNGAATRWSATPGGSSNRPGAARCRSGAFTGPSTATSSCSSTSP